MTQIYIRAVLNRDKKFKCVSQPNFLYLTNPGGMLLPATHFLLLQKVYLCVSARCRYSVKQHQFYKFKLCHVIKSINKTPIQSLTATTETIVVGGINSNYYSYVLGWVCNHAFHQYCYIYKLRFLLLLLLLIASFDSSDNEVTLSQGCMKVGPQDFSFSIFPASNSFLVIMERQRFHRQ